MSLRVLSTLAVLLIPGALFAQAPADAFQVRYASNLNVGESYINITNAGSIDGNDPAGRICVNVYAYNPDEEPASCCTCLVTPNGLRSLRVNADLNTNTLIAGEHFDSLVIKLYASVPVNGGCNAAAPGAAAPGMRAWGTTLHRVGTDGFALTETAFSPATLSAGELGKLTSVCAFTQQYASGHGICGSCALGGLATALE
jgi:hypothetical protein